MAVNLPERWDRQISADRQKKDLMLMLFSNDHSGQELGRKGDKII